MRTDAPSPIKLHAIAATILTNLVVFAAWVVEWAAWWPFQAAIKRSLRAKLRRGFQAVARIAFLLAAHQREAPKRRPRVQHPANKPPGFRLQSSRRAARFLHVSGVSRGSIQERIARLKRMLENIEPWVALFLKRLRKRRPSLHLVRTRVLAEAIVHASRVFEPSGSDTS